MSNSSLTIRRATIDDVVELRSFEQEVIRAERPFAQDLADGPIHYYDIEHLISNDDCLLLVVESIDGLVGSGYARIEVNKPHLKGDFFAYLGFMFVTEEYRGKGVNGRVLEALKEWSKSKGVRFLKLDVYQDNAAAVKAYTKAGFTANLVEMVLEL